MKNILIGTRKRIARMESESGLGVAVGDEWNWNFKWSGCVSGIRRIMTVGMI